MRKYNIKNKKYKKIAYIVVYVLLLIIAVSISFAYERRKQAEVTAVSIDTTMASTNIEETPVDEEQPKNNLENTPMMASEFLDNIVDNTKYTVEYQTIASDLEKLKAGDTETVEKYFGISDVFTPEAIADRVSASTITFMSSSELEDGTTEVVIHVCTIDYNTMNNDYIAAESKQAENEDSETKAKKEVTRKLIENAYDVHYNIPVIVKDGTVVLSESLKHAITGGWYTGIGVELTPVECVLK